MGEKKDRGRFTIKFNENDPAHEAVISILEQQGPRQKARFLVNAVLHYIHCPETPDISVSSFQLQDKEVIEKIVLGILKQQGIEKAKPETKKEVPAPKIEEKGVNLPTKNPYQNTDSPGMDDEMMALIANTMSAFRRD